MRGLAEARPAGSSEPICRPWAPRGPWVWVGSAPSFPWQEAQIRAEGRAGARAGGVSAAHHSGSPGGVNTTKRRGSWGWGTQRPGGGSWHSFRDRSPLSRWRLMEALTAPPASHGRVMSSVVCRMATVPTGGPAVPGQEPPSAGPTQESTRCPCLQQLKALSPAAIPGQGKASLTTFKGGGLLASGASPR